MKWRMLPIGISVLLLGSAVHSVADARPSAANTTWPRSLISEPCVSVGVQGPGSGPARVVCTGVTGRTATINVPTPWLSDRTPELSLVNIPAFFNLQWDPDSVGASDSQPLTLSYPAGSGATDRLDNVRVQLRFRAVNATGESSVERLVSENVEFEGSGQLYLIPAAPSVSMDKAFEAYSNYACNAIKDPAGNALLTVVHEEGGYNPGTKDKPEGALATCKTMAGKLEPVKGFDPDGFDPEDVPRYLGWDPLSMSRFLAFTPFASIHGAGTDRGSPAFQISATTRFQLEARVMFDKQTERYEYTTTDCQWSYRDDYDFIDWSRWPKAPYCRTNVVVDWMTFCEPFGSPSCDQYYGDPEDWWVPYVPALEVQAIRRPDGTYGRTYDFVSVQSQALLAAP